MLSVPTHFLAVQKSNINAESDEYRTSLCVQTDLLQNTKSFANVPCADEERRAHLRTHTHKSQLSVVHLRTKLMCRLQIKSRFL